MTVEIRTTGVKPIRNTFEHLAKRFGDKNATRYQEIAYDIQPLVNFHYKPLWDPTRDLYDVRRTAVVMKDWYALKDPRQYYYGAYTITRAKQQDALDRQLEFVEKRELLRVLPAAARQQLVKTLVPLRHYEFGANMNNSHMAGYGFGTIYTQAAMMNCMDRLGMAQHLSRIGLLTDGNTGESLTEGKRQWMEEAAWQGVRREVEHLFVTRDWFELHVAQNLVADSLVYPLFYQHFDAAFAAQNGSALSSLTDYLMRWYDETSRWVDAIVKTAAAESPENAKLISEWTVKWRDIWVAALEPAAAAALGDKAADVLAAVVAAFNTKAGKLGLKL
ncbi:phenol 2-monooxygenase P1 subunit [Panacagrimonas perspica]|uniref:Phenol 2-monooxygenase P1 subunit n=1 Tax=Panacagrimonas perspica TaxID=381431 RepID=A0A4V3URM0_9GAMM|nr:aromatic/alkene monooxygenase hydroxylase subunit beta [Panacagrimonas perspica]TDU28523.1 phenol 2-monooxygenase P1 subunit [Panacagrimonas perspica]THD03381.1 phenol hydroxylase [Panacagrimonas perspica]